jgi:pyridoxal phosphate enzyme (YggS family)
MSVVAEQLRIVHQRMADACARAQRDVAGVRLIAVTKTATRQQIREALDAGIIDLGENRAQVLNSHADELAEDAPGRAVNWHMIGHLQRNKVRDVLPLVKMVHSVDSQRLAAEINQCAWKLGLTMPVLVEVNAGEEEQKYGVRIGDTAALVEQMRSMANLDVRGLMCMAPFTDDQQRIRSTFARARDLFQQVASSAHRPPNWSELSMGMSNDFEIAIEEGATMVRVGSLLFGSAA